MSTDFPSFDPKGFVPGLDDSPPGNASESGNHSNIAANQSDAATSHGIASIPDDATPGDDDVTPSDNDAAVDAPADEVVDDADPAPNEQVNVTANHANRDTDSVKSAWSRTPILPGWGRYPVHTSNVVAMSNSDNSEFEFLAPDVQHHRAVLDK